MGPMNQPMGPQGGPPPGAPPGGPMQGRPNPVEQNRSVMNPTDLATMASRGEIRRGMTVRDFIEGVLKVPLDAPVQALAQATQKQAQNANPMQKMGNIAQGGQPQGPPPGQPRPQPGPQGPPAGAPGGLSALMGG